MRIPPPIIGAVTAGAMWLVAESTGLRIDVPASGFVALALIGAGLSLDLWAILAFRKAKTTVNPLAPENTSAIVTGGPYKFSRNPMYLGLLIVLTGLMVYLGDPTNVLLLAAFVAAVTLLQIRPEERILSSKFGAEYEAYASQTRRWI